MKRTLSILISTLGWFAVIAQYFLMIENRVATITETTIRFFSYFTILTNSLCAIYFTAISVSSNGPSTLNKRSAILTPITVYITVVGLVYQIVLRHLWEPKGMQKVVDELLHSIIPAVVIIFWYFFGQVRKAKYTNSIKWLIYPVAYFILILMRGNIAGFYPYPFIDVSQIGILKALQNSLLLMLLFVFLSMAFIFIGKKFGKHLS